MAGKGGDVSNPAIKLIDDARRSYALRCVANAPEGYLVTIKPLTRSLDANAKMWAMIADVRRADPEQRGWSAEVRKCAFMSACGHELRLETGLNGEPFPAGFRSSRLTVAQMSELIECIYEYGARFGVEWTETRMME